MKDFRDNFDVNEIALGILRIFTGGALFVKGMSFMMNMHALYDLTAQTLPFSNLLIAHLIVFAHVIGGFCLMIGLVTRTAAICNIPIIVGAIFFVHSKEGLFSSTLGLELTVMLLVVLTVLAIAGSKFLSVDNIIQNKLDKNDRKRLRKAEPRFQLKSQP